MNRYSIIISVVSFYLVSCATPPSGIKELAPMIEKDRQNAEGVLNVRQGRPLYVKAFAHPQILPSGDVWGGGPILLLIGRETVSFESMLKEK